MIGEGLFSFGDVDGVHPKARLQHPLGVTGWGSVLLVAVTLFEIDMRLHDWTVRAAASPYYANGTVTVSLWIHLFFAVPTAVLWVWVIVQALRRFSQPPQPGEHSPRHIFWGRVAAIEMVLTAVTGWIFYWLAFAAV